MEDHMSLIRNGYTVSARWELGVSGGTLCGLIPDEVARDIAMVHPVKAAPYFAHAQFSGPETIMALPDPGEAMPYVKAMWRYSRDIALQGNFDAPTRRAWFLHNLRRAES
jgi:hypothetical protein